MTIGNIDRKLLRILKQLTLLEYLHPRNDTSERQKFIDSYKKGQLYNPQYKYKHIEFNLEKIESELNSIEISDPIYKKLIEHLVDLVKAFRFIGTENSIILYDPPTRELYLKARKLIPLEKGNKDEGVLNSHDVKKIFKVLLNEYDMTDWKVHLRKKMSANASVEGSTRGVYIKQKKFSFREVNALRAHEIETHALRSQNGYQQSCKLLGYMGLPGYLPTEEGLATLMEELTGNISTRRLRSICIRAIAAYLAQTKSFYEVFDIIHKKYHFSIHSAYVITRRIKRGLADTSGPGGFMKDHVYFQGRLEVEKFIKDGGDIRLLFACKIGIQHIPLIKRGILKKPTILPKLFSNKIFDMIIRNSIKHSKFHAIFGKGIEIEEIRPIK